MNKDIDNIQFSPSERLRILKMMLGTEKNAEYKFPGGQMNVQHFETGSFSLKLLLSNFGVTAEFKFCADGKLFSSKEYQSEIDFQNYTHISVDKYLAGIKDYHRVPLAA